MSEIEEVLPGGNVNKAVRVGDTIRRSANNNSYVNNYPDIAPYMWSDTSLIKIAKLQRKFHDATRGFASEAIPKNAYPDPSINEVVCHSDAATVSYSPDLHAGNRRRQIALFFENYGMEAPDNLKQWVIERLQALCTTLSQGAANGEKAFVKKRLNVCRF